MNTTEVRAHLRKMYPSTHWCLIEEMRNANGFDATRSADALAIGFYRSRGQQIIGFEIKVSRGDWLQELKNPGKADEIAQYCDHWYLVVGDQNIVKAGELPPTWGLIAPTKSGKTMRIQVRADLIKHVPPDRTFFTAVVKQAVDCTIGHTKRQYGLDAIEDRVTRERAKAAEEARRLNDNANQRLRDEVAETRKNVADFEQASGIRLTHYQPFKQLGAALRALIEQDNHALRNLHETIRRTESVVGLYQTTTQELMVTLEGLNRLKAQLKIEEREKTDAARTS